MISRDQKKGILTTLSLVEYDKIILFGSRARGDSNSQSDFDLLLILSHHASIAEKIRLATDLRKRFASNLIDADIIVKDAEDVRYLKDKPGSIVRNALREGVTL